MTNKTVKLIFLGLFILGVIMVGVAILLGASSYLAINSSGFHFERSEMGEIITENVSEDISVISIDDYALGEIKVTSGEQATITYPSNYVHMYESKGSLNITAKQQRIGFVLLDIDRLFWNWKEQERSVIITLPEDHNIEILDIDANAGDIDIENLVIESVSVVSNVGKVDITNLQSHDTTVLSSVADVDITNLQTWWLDVAGHVGDISITDSEIEKITGEQNTGDFDIENTISSDIDVNGNLGEISIELVGDPADYTIKAEVDLGKFSLDGQEIPTPTVQGEGANKIDVRLNTGDVGVEFKN